MTETRRPGVDPFSEDPTEIVEEEISIEKTPALFDAEAELAERVRGDFAGVLGRQQDVGVARMNAGNIAQSVMRLKGLGG